MGSSFGKYIYDRTRNRNETFVMKLFTKLETTCRPNIHICVT